MPDQPHRTVAKGATADTRRNAIDAANKSDQQVVVVDEGGRVSAVATQPARPVPADSEGAAK